MWRISWFTIFIFSLSPYFDSCERDATVLNNVRLTQVHRLNWFSRNVYRGTDATCVCWRQVALSLRRAQSAALHRIQQIAQATASHATDSPADAANYNHPSDAHSELRPSLLVGNALRRCRRQWNWMRRENASTIGLHRVRVAVFHVKTPESLYELRRFWPTGKRALNACDACVELGRANSHCFLWTDFFRSLSPSLSLSVLRDCRPCNMIMRSGWWREHKFPLCCVRVRVSSSPLSVRADATVPASRLTRRWIKALRIVCNGLRHDRLQVFSS